MIGGGLALVAVAGVLGITQPWRTRPPVVPVDTATAQAPAVSPPAPAPAPIETVTTQETPPVAPPQAAHAAPAGGNPAPKPPPVKGTTPSTPEGRLHDQPANPDPAVTHTGGGRIVADPQELERDRNLYLKLLGSAQAARQAAVTVGAVEADLSGGDLLLKNAQTMAEAQQYTATTDPLNSATAAYVSAAATARERTAAAARAAAQAAPPSAPVASVAEEQGSVRAVVQEYSRALSNGDLNSALTAYPGMPTDMQNGYKEWFEKGSRMDASKWTITSINVSGTSATALMTGPIALVDKKGKASAKSDGPKTVTLAKGAGGWHITGLSN
jgi:ketosteroid isomerase-like protein